jgi:hypothetical protein
MVWYKHIVFISKQTTKQKTYHLYGYPPAKELSVFPVDDKTEITQINDTKIKNATVLDIFHDVVIHAQLSVPIITKDALHID